MGKEDPLESIKRVFQIKKDASPYWFIASFSLARITMGAFYRSVEFSIIR